MMHFTECLYKQVLLHVLHLSWKVFQRQVLLYCVNSLGSWNVPYEAWRHWQHSTTFQEDHQTRPGAATYRQFWGKLRANTYHLCWSVPRFRENFFFEDYPMFFLLAYRRADWYFSVFFVLFCFWHKIYWMIKSYCFTYHMYRAFCSASMIVV